MNNKKLLTLTLAATLSLSLVACSGGNQKDNTKENNTKVENTANTEKAEAPAEETEVGQGTFYLENESGTTEKGDPIVIYDDGNETQILQIGIVTTDFDGSKLTYVYVDGELLTKEQFGDTATVLSLEQDQLKEGLHQVVLKQYENDDENTDPTMVKFASYEVKMK